MTEATVADDETYIFHLLDDGTQDASGSPLIPSHVRAAEESFYPDMPMACVGELPFESGWYCDENIGEQEHVGVQEEDVCGGARSSHGVTEQGEERVEEIPQRVYAGQTVTTATSSGVCSTKEPARAVVGEGWTRGVFSDDGDRVQFKFLAPGELVCVPRLGSSLSFHDDELAE